MHLLDLNIYKRSNKKEDIAIIHSLSELILITFNQRIPPLFYCFYIGIACYETKHSDILFIFAGNTRNMQPQVILITGASSGFGKITAQMLSEQGHIVYGTSRKPSEDMNQVKMLVVDVTNSFSVCQAVERILSEQGRIDVLINNAGIASMNHILLTPKTTAERVFNTNFMGTFLMSRECAKFMIRQKNGRIVNYSTVAVALNLQGELVYSSSKAAIEQLTRVLATEIGESGVTVNAVGPTPIDTDLIKNVPGNKIEELKNRQCIKRLGNFEDVKNVIDFFIRPESEFITGQIIYLGGVF